MVMGTPEAFAEEPIADQPMAEEPITDRPMADGPIADEPIADQPIPERPVDLRQMEDRPPGFRDESGYTLALGWGPSFGGVGFSLGYTFEPSSIVHLSPYVGVGVSVLDVNGGHEIWPGTAAGMLTSIGRRHRATIDVTFGTTEYEGLQVYGYELRRRTWGVSALVGYAYVTKNYFMVRGAIGPSFMVAPYSPEGERWSLSTMLAVGKVF